jgi:CRISPR-associated protein Csx3
MYSYQIQLEGDVLRVGFNRLLPAAGDRIVRDALELVEQMIESGQLPGGSHVLKIDGPQSVPVAYVIAHKLAHLYEAIAVLDPKIGRKGHKTYIVTITHGSEQYRIGDLIESEESQRERNKIKVVLCGPPRSGKSCLREGLKKAILSHLNAPYPYVITACPDGEGSWHQATYENNEELAQTLKPLNKGDITPEFAQTAAEWVRSANQLINIIDVGGKISPENRTIMQEATHAIIVFPSLDQFSPWETFCHELNLKVIAKIHSQLAADTDEVFLPYNWQTNTNQLLAESPLLTGSIHRLQRGEDVSNRPLVKALAELLIHLTKY